MRLSAAFTKALLGIAIVLRLITCSSSCKIQSADDTLNFERWLAKLLIKVHGFHHQIRSFVLVRSHTFYF